MRIMNTCLQKLRFSGLLFVFILLSACNALPLRQPAESANAQPATPPPASPVTIIRPARSVETRTLQRLLMELERMDALVIEASRHADPDARMRFDYQLLRRDMQLIVRGIEAHIRAESQSPPSIEPIAGDYVR